MKRILTLLDVRRLGLLGRFVLLTALALCLLGFGLAHVLRTGARENALRQAASFARGIVALSVGGALGGDSPEDGLEPATIQRLDGVLTQSRSAEQLLRFKLWNQAGTVVYSDDHALIGRTFPPGGDLRSALDGKLTPNLARGDDGEAEHVEDAALGDLIEVYVPLAGAEGAAPTGVAESYLSFAPFQREVAIGDRRLALALGGGLLLLLLLLIPIVSGASRRLRRQSATNHYLSLHDPLTGLPNRTFFAARVESLLALVSEHRPGVAVMLLDLDGFKEINDSLGHSVGDDLLVDVGRRLERGLPPAGTIARLGGDEFGIVLPAGQDREAAFRVAHDLIATLEEPFAVDGISMGISASVGVAISPEHGQAPNDLLRRADIAMYSAKRSQQGVVVYRGDLDPASRESIHLVADLRRAIADGELRLHYQPKVDMARRAVRGVEALVRWEHPDRGLLSPDTFIPLAEQSALIQPLTAWVIDEAVRQCREWADAGCHLPVAVNLSQMSLLDLSIPAMVADALERHRVPPRMLDIEITETAFAGDLRGAAVLLGEVDALGVTLAIDDYGTGFSSIAHLSQLPVSSIKIDRSFVATMGESSKSETIVRSIIRLARDLDLGVVAEGVETREEWSVLESLGCRTAQGYFVSKPLPADELLAWLRHQRRPGSVSAPRVPALV